MYISPRFIACLLALLILSSGPLIAQQYEWAGQIGGGGQSWTHSIGVDGDKNVVVLGEAGGAIDLDPGPGTFNVTSAQNFIVKLDSNGVFLWGGGFSPTTPAGNLSPRGLVTNAAGTICIVGQMQGRADFDMGPGIDTLGPQSGHIGTYFVRYTAGGQYLGTKILEDVSSQLEPGAIIGIDDQDNVYFLGNFSGSVDVDMGPGVYTLASNGSFDTGLMKYDSALALQWAIPLAGGNSVEVAPNRVYVAASLGGQLDVDPGPGTALLTNANFYADPYLVAYSQAGNYLWADQWEGEWFNSGFYVGVKANAAGHVLVGMRYEGDLDLDPSTNVQMSNIIGGSDILAILLDSNGTYQWGKRIGCSTRDEVQGMDLGPSGMVYLLTNFSGNIDMDPGIGQSILGVPSLGNIDAAVLKLNPAGEMVWVAEVSGPDYDWFYELTVDDEENIYFGGELYQTVDFDPSPGGVANLSSAGMNDGFIAKWSIGMCENLTLTIDSLRNGSCQNPVVYMAGIATMGQQPYAYQWNTSPMTLDSAATTATFGIYTLSVTDGLGCQRQREVLVAGPTLLGAFDLSAFLVAGNFRPGIATTVTIDAFNSGCSLVAGQLKLALDPLAAYQSAIPLPDLVTADTLFWNAPPMNYDSTHFIVQVSLLTDTTAQATDTIHLGLVITPIAGDQNPQDNIRDYYAFPVVNSFDPNIKQVYPPGYCQGHYVLQGEPLNYTVQFQNTGNAEALEVDIRDSLDAGLDLASLKIVAVSHPMVTSFLPGNVLLFQFHNIHLPDSSTNEPASHGYVIYEVMPSANTVSGTEVSNKADIFFDYNAPVRTNTVMNTLVDVLPACAVAIAPPLSDMQLQIAPNPADGLLLLRVPMGEETVQISNLLGQIMWRHSTMEASPISSKDQVNEVLIDVSSWPAGLYFVTAAGKTQRVQVLHR